MIRKFWMKSTKKALLQLVQKTKKEKNFWLQTRRTIQNWRHPKIKSLVRSKRNRNRTNMIEYHLKVLMIVWRSLIRLCSPKPSTIYLQWIFSVLQRLSQWLVMGSVLRQLWVKRAGKLLEQPITNSLSTLQISQMFHQINKIICPLKVRFSRVVISGSKLWISIWRRLNKRVRCARLFNSTKTISTSPKWRSLSEFKSKIKIWLEILWVPKRRKKVKLSKICLL